MSSSWSHKEETVATKSWWLTKYRELSFRFRIAQIFSIGFRSGLYGGHSIGNTSLSARYRTTDCALWHGALSCWNLPMSSLKGTMCLSKTLMYFVAVIVPSIISSGPVPLEVMQPQMSVLLTNGRWATQCAGLIDSFLYRRTYLGRGVRWKSTYVSSENTYFSQSATFNEPCCLHQFRRIRFWPWVHFGDLHGRYGNRPIRLR